MSATAGEDLAYSNKVHMGKRAHLPLYNNFCCYISLQIMFKNHVDNVAEKQLKACAFLLLKGSDANMRLTSCKAPIELTVTFSGLTPYLCFKNTGRIGGSER